MDRLTKIQELLKEKSILYSYSEEDGCGSVDFLHRGLPYHIWEYTDDTCPCGVETNVFHAGRSEDIEGDYENTLVEELKNW